MTHGTSAEQDASTRVQPAPVSSTGEVFGRRTPRHHALVFALMVAVGVAGCGTGSAGTSDRASRGAVNTAAVTTPAPASTSTPITTSVPVAAPRRTRHVSHHRKTRPTGPALSACDANIDVEASTTTCPFAQNVFYEYWQATQVGDRSSIEAYSPAAQRTYSLRCSGGTRIACRAKDGSYVSFPAAAVDAYDSTQADKFACAADLGPSNDDCSSGQTETDTGDSFGSDGGCDPNYAGACLDPDAIDYDCDSMEGDGPEYTGQVEVVGDDHYGLDRDGDGTGCDDSSSSDDGSSGSYDPSSPTTEDFGSGSGSVGYCADGTLSDSIGRQGACSHHGGVG